jgi:hypothetical protein
MATDAGRPRMSRKTVAFIVAASLLWVAGYAGDGLLMYRG